VSCTEATKTCRFTWNDATNLVKTTQFKVFRVNGFGKVQIYSANGSGPAGTLAYTIIENTNNSVYEAKGYIHTNTTNSWYDFDTATLNFIKQMRELFHTTGLFPLLLLMISMMAALLDVGAIGVLIGSLLVLFVGMITGILAITPMMFISMAIIGGILIARIRA